MELFKATYGTPRAMDTHVSIPRKRSRTDSSNLVSHDQKKQLKAVRDGSPAQNCKKTRYLEKMETSIVYIFTQYVKINYIYIKTYFLLRSLKHLEKNK